MNGKAKNRLIVNADDLGFSKGITEGILRAHREGIVTSTSIMVNQPASEYALERLRSAPGLELGIHLDLCEAGPVLPSGCVPTLVRRDGKFHRFEDMKRKLLLRQVSAGEIEAEFIAQIRWLRGHGVEPAHADSHCHLHLYPAAAAAFRRAVSSEGIRFIRSARQRHWPSTGDLCGPHIGRWYRRIAVRMYLHVLQRFFDRRFVSATFRLATHPRYRDRLDKIREALIVLLENLPAGSYEFVCHPAMFEPGFSETDPLGQQRCVELDVLTDPELRAVIDRNNIELITYAQLSQQSGEVIRQCPYAKTV